MKRLLLVILLVGTAQAYDIPPYIKGHSTFSIRSQSTNGARKCATVHPLMRMHKKDTIHGFFTVSPSYSHSIRSAHIAESIWGSQTFAISGSLVPGRQNTDLMADYFGLSQNFFSNVTFKPVIKTAQCVFDWYTCFDKVLHGLYVRVYAPFVWTRWNMRIAEDIKETGLSTPFGPGYMDAGAIIPTAASFADTLRGTTTFGQMQEPLAYGKVTCAQSKHAFSDVQVSMGYDCIRSWLGTVNTNIFVGIPTGTRVKAEHIFQPQIGNGKHWEVGIGCSGWATLWERDGDYTLGFYGDVTLSTLLRNRQHRSFDIKTDRNLSRYMLIKEFDANRNYTGSMAPLINKTTLACHVHTNIQLDIVAMLSFCSEHWVCDAGYNGWIRTKECISLAEPFPQNTYGLKGIQNVVILPNTLSNATQSTATIYGNEFLLPSDQSGLMDPDSPVLLSEANLDFGSGASPRLITHKGFLSLGYVWDRYTYINPLLSIGAEIEFEGTNPDKTVQEYRHTLSLWSLWLKGGFTF
jgi:hypothetical protein